MGEASDDLLSFSARDLQAAREWCERTLELNPEMPSAIMLLALIFTAQKDYKAAIELIVDVLDDFPTNYPFLVLKLKLEVKFGNYSCLTALILK